MSKRRRPAAPRKTPGVIRVLAGVNGAGKSSVLGEAIRAARADYYNPDEAARAFLAASPHLTPAEANARAWLTGKLALERAIAEGADFAFETTLGGQTIAELLEQALIAGLRVEMRYLGLDSAERHIARVQARVAAGGHDIPEDKIRERYSSSRANLVRLLPRLSRVEVFDNSREAAPESRGAPEPVPLLTVERGRVTFIAPRASMPEWAKPIAAAAMAHHLESDY